MERTSDAIRVVILRGEKVVPSDRLSIRKSAPIALVKHSFMLLKASRDAFPVTPPVARQLSGGLHAYNSETFQFDTQAMDCLQEVDYSRDFNTLWRFDVTRQTIDGSAVQCVQALHKNGRLKVPAQLVEDPQLGLA